MGGLQSAYYQPHWPQGTHYILAEVKKHPVGLCQCLLHVVDLTTHQAAWPAARPPPPSAAAAPGAHAGRW
jgi:hypothetical protein